MPNPRPGPYKGTGRVRREMWTHRRPATQHLTAPETAPTRHVSSRRHQSRAGAQTPPAATNPRRTEQGNGGRGEGTTCLWAHTHPSASGLNRTAAGGHNPRLYRLALRHRCAALPQEVHCGSDQATGASGRGVARPGQLAYPRILTYRTSHRDFSFATPRRKKPTTAGSATHRRASPKQHSFFAPKTALLFRA